MNLAYLNQVTPMCKRILKNNFIISYMQARLPNVSTASDHAILFSKTAVIRIRAN